MKIGRFVEASDEADSLTQGDMLYYRPYNLPVDSYTKLLVHYNGTDGQTTYTAETGQTLTFSGSAVLDDAQKEFGTTSLYLPVSQYTSAPDSDDWNFGSGDFTLDLWARFSDSSQEYSFLGQLNSTTTGMWYFAKRAASDPDGGLWFRSINTSGSSTGYFQSAALSWNSNQWYHLAVVRNGSSCYMFRDGTSLSVTQVNAWGTLDNIDGTLRIGHGESMSWQGAGWLDEVRISKGIARWTSGFTPPTTEYPFVGTGGGAGTAINVGWKRLGIGTSGQYLKVSSTGLPYWSA